MGPSGAPKSKSPSMVADEMVGYQYAFKSHVLIAKMFFFKIGYMFVSLPVNILNLSHLHLTWFKCLLGKQVCFKFVVSIVD
jgi:hypothetical protein